MAGTSYLYTGEQADVAMGDSYYLRARFYMPGPAMFSSLDPYFGDTGEPQSLHKYAHVHGDPVNAWVPSGPFSFGSVFQSIGISSVYITLSTTTLSAIAAILTGQSISDGLIAGFQLSGAVSIL
jgi:RHS repeat-associated protein